MMASPLTRERLLAIFCCAVLLFNYPLLSLVDLPPLILGVPVLYLYLFGVWGGLIFLVGWFIERGRH
jgi:hypothetical protein